MIDKKEVRTLDQLLFTNAGEQTICIFSAREKMEIITHWELRANAAALAYSLEHQGVKRGDKVVLISDDSKQIITSFWSCILAGIIPVPIARGISDDHKLKVKYVWEDLKDAWLIIDDVHFERLCEFFSARGESKLETQLRNRRLKDSILTESSFKKPEANLGFIKPEDVAYIQYSSGSTARPKGIVLTHRNLVQNVRDISMRSKITIEDHALSWMPLHHDMGMICFHLTSVWSGINQTIVPTEIFIRRPLIWLELISKQRASLIYSPNFGLKYALAALKENHHHHFNLSTVRLLYNGAEMISPRICREFEENLNPFGLSNKVMFPGYGLAEASVAVSLPEPGEPLRTYFLSSSSFQIGRPVHQTTPDAADVTEVIEVGFAMDSTSIRICDDEGFILTDLHLGHIQIKGLSVTSGYLGRHNNDKEIFTPDGWLKTGDIGFLRKGRLIITGRFKEMIILNGQNYFSNDLESALIDQVHFETGKVAIASHQFDAVEQLLVFVYHKGNLDDFALKVKLVNQRLVHHFGITPNRVIPVRKIPKTTSGKIQRHKLVENFRSGLYDNELGNLKTQSPVGLAGALEVQIEAVIKDVFKHASNSKVDLLAGLSSLEFVRLLAAINDRFHLRLSPQQLNGAATISELSTIIKKESQQPSTKIELEDQAHYPLTRVQKRLYYLQALYQDARLNVASGYEIVGAISASRMREAFFKLVETCEILRSRIFFVANEPRILSDTIDFDKLKFYHVEGISLENVNQEFKRHANTRLDPEDGHLVKLIFVSTTDSRQFLLLVINHLICDGYSIELMWNQLFEIYSDSNQDCTAQIAGYCADQLNRSLDPHYSVSRKYWQEKYINEIVTLRFPQYFANASPGLAQIKSLDLPSHVIKAVQEVLDQYRVSHHPFFQAIFNLTAHYYTGQANFSVATEYLNRHTYGEFARLGHYINTVLIDAKLDGSLTTGQYLSLFAAEFREAIKFGDYDFDDLLESSDVSSLQETLTSLFLYQDFNNFLAWKQTNQITDVKPFTENVDSALVPFQFECIQSMGGARIELALKFDESRFSSSFADAFINTYLQILVDAINNHQQTIHQLLSRTRQQQHRPLFSLGKVRKTLPSTLVPSLIDHHGINNPDRVALVCDDVSFTYGELNNTTNRIASTLTDKFHIGPGKFVMTHLKPSAGYVLIMIGVWKAGGTLVPLDTEYPTERKKFIYQEVLPGLVITETDLPFTIGGVPLLRMADLLTSNNQSNLHAIQGTTTAYVLFTSGTTGTPKGVMIEHQSLMDYVEGFIKYFEINQDDRIIQQSSVGFDTSMEEILPILCAGGRLVVHTNSAADIESLLNQMNRHNITILSTTPLVINELNQRNTLPKSLRALISGGDVLRPNFLSNIPHTIATFNSYGPTETTVCATYHRVNLLSPTISIGKPLDNVTIFIVDDSMTEVAPFQIGQLLIGGIKVGKGYINNYTLTQEKFIIWQDSTGQQHRVYQSGDLGYWDHEGSITLFGRADNQVKVNGYRVELTEIENVLRQHTQVLDALVVIDNADDGSSLLAYVITDTLQDGIDFIHFLQKKLPHYMIPKSVIPLREWPRNANGKIDKKALPPPLSETSPLKSEVRHPLHDNLVNIWESVINRKIQSIHQNFFQLGGNSLQAIKIVNRIRKDLGYQVAMSQIFQYQTISGVAEFLLHQPEMPMSHLTDLTLKGDVIIASHAQKRLWLLENIDQTGDAYRLEAVCHIKGRFNADRLNTAITALVNKHEILRTTFEIVEDEVMQRIHPMLPNEKVFKFCALADFENEQSFLNQTFDLGALPLFRFALVEEGEDKYKLHFVIHHIIFDLRSSEILIQELLDQYLNDTSTEIGSFQYRHFVAWEHKLIEQHADQLSSFWKKELSGTLPILNFPFSKPRPLKKNYSGEAFYWDFHPDQYKKMVDACLEYEVTPFIFLLTLSYCSIYSLTNAPDIIVGTAINLRDQPAFANQIGLYLNELPLRCHLDERTTLKVLIHQIKQNVISAYQHKSYPLDFMTRDLNVKRELARAPLFDLTIDMGLPSISSLTIPENAGVEIKLEMQQHVESSKFDLSIHFDDSKEQLKALVTFNSGLFDKTEVTSIMERFNECLDHFLNSDHLSLRQYLDKIKYERNATDTNHRKSKKKMLGQLFDNQSLKK